jgi:hypothetical protein
MLSIVDFWSAFLKMENEAYDIVTLLVYPPVSACTFPNDFRNRFL